MKKALPSKNQPKMSGKIGSKPDKNAKMTAGAASGEGRLQKAGIKMPKKK